MLRGRYPDTTGGALLSAVAEATLLAAWMTYDSTPHSPQAQRYFIQALGLASRAGDRLLGAAILDAMSHQAPPAPAASAKPPAWPRQPGPGPPGLPPRR